MLLVDSEHVRIHSWGQFGHIEVRPHMGLCWIPKQVGILGALYVGTVMGKGAMVERVS